MAGRYRLDRMLGQGGMGVVWAATHTITRRGVAMKFLKGPAHARPEMRRRFLREARAAATVQHPSVVEVHDVFELDDETPVMVMDLLVGETLAQRIANQGPLSIHQTASILLPVVSAVGTAHSRGVVHRDLKPENIFLAENEEGKTEVKVLDFGIAKLANLEGEAVTQSQLTGTGAMLGTPCYSAPEQLFGERLIDHRADVWALGVVFYECLSNQLPVYGENLGQILKMLTSGEILPLEKLVPDLPGDILSLVGRMLSRSLDSRPKDMREVLTTLQRYSNLSVRSFGDAKSQPPAIDSHPSGGSRQAPVHSKENETVVASAMKTTPEAGLDTASPHAVSQDASPRSRKVVVLAGAAFAAGLVAMIGWQLGHTREPAPTFGRDGAGPSSFDRECGFCRRHRDRSSAAPHTHSRDCASAGRCCFGFRGSHGVSRSQEPGCGAPWSSSKARGCKARRRRASARFRSRQSRYPEASRRPD